MNRDGDGYGCGDGDGYCDSDGQITIPDVTPVTRPVGRPAHTLCGITARQWATALGPLTATRLRRAQAVLAGTTRPTSAELVRVADTYGIDLSELVRAVSKPRP